MAQEDTFYNCEKNPKVIDSM